MYKNECNAKLVTLMVHGFNVLCKIYYLILKFKVCQNQKIKSSCLTFLQICTYFFFFPFKVVNSFLKIKIKSLT